MAQGVFIALSQARAFQREVAIAESQRKSASQNLPQDDGEEDATESEEDADEVDGMEGDEEETTQKTESKRHKRHKRHKADENKKENAAGGDWELPSMFRALRGSDPGMQTLNHTWFVRQPCANWPW